MLTSDGRHDTLFLSNYATIRVKDKLACLAGVGEAAFSGARDYSMRVFLDPAKLAGRDLTSADVVRVLLEEKKGVAAGAIGKPPVPAGEGFELKVLGRLVDADSFGDVIVRVDKEGRVIRLRDVGEVKPGPAGEVGSVRYKGKPAVALGVAPSAGVKRGQASAAVRAWLAEARADLPPGVSMEVVFDAAAKGARHLRLDVTLPDAASHERTQAVLEKCERLLTGMEGVAAVMTICGQTLGGHVASNHGAILVGPTAAMEGGGRERLAAAIRAKLSDEIHDAVVRVGDLRRPGLSGEGYGIVLAIHGGDDRRNLAATAESFADELRKSGKLSDVGLGPEGRVACPSLLVDVNREKARALGIDIGDVFTTLQVYLGSMYVNDFNRFGRTWQVIVGAEGAERRNIETLKRMTVKNAAGELVPLGAVVVVRDTHGPALVRRFNGAPMITVGANRGPGVLADEARALCEAAARKVLSKGYEMEWLHAP